MDLVVNRLLTGHLEFPIGQDPQRKIQWKSMSWNEMYRMCINGELGHNFSQIDCWQVKIFHNGPRNFPPKSLVPSEVTDPWRIIILTYHVFLLHFLNYLYKDCLKKNIVKYNLFATKLSSKNILDQFFVWLLIMEKTAGNWENFIFDVRKRSPNHL